MTNAATMPRRIARTARRTPARGRARRCGCPFRRSAASGCWKTSRSGTLPLPRSAHALPAWQNGVGFPWARTWAVTRVLNAVAAVDPQGGVHGFVREHHLRHLRPLLTVEPGQGPERRPAGLRAPARRQVMAGLARLMQPRLCDGVRGLLLPLPCDLRAAPGASHPRRRRIPGRVPELCGCRAAPAAWRPALRCLAVPERRHVRQPRDGGVQLQVPARVRGRKLRAALHRSSQRRNLGYARSPSFAQLPKVSAHADACLLSQTAPRLSSGGILSWTASTTPSRRIVSRCRAHRPLRARAGWSSTHGTIC